jgi:hypothetical protein
LLPAASIEQCGFGGRAVHKDIEPDEMGFYEATMNRKIKDWILGFPCSRCAFLGVEKLGTVLVLGQDDVNELQVIAFCYDCARVMMAERRKRPAPSRRGTANSTDPSRKIVKLERRSNPLGENPGKTARPPI